MQTKFENEEYQIFAGLYFDDAGNGIDITVRKNCSDMGFGWHYNIYTGIIFLTVPFVCVNIYTPFYIPEED